MLVGPPWRRLREQGSYHNQRRRAKPGLRGHGFRALNGHENVAEPVRQLVLEVAARLRYTPHAAARSLSSRRTNTVGVVLPDLYGEFFSELMRGIDNAARNRRQHLLVSSYHGDQEQQGAALRAMRGRVDGLLVLSPYAESPGFLTDNLPQSLPTVLINTYLPAGPPGAEHRRPCRRDGDDPPPAGRRPPPHCLHFWPDLNFDARERLRGFRDALAAFGSGAEASSCPVISTKLPAIAPVRSCWQPERCPMPCSPPTT
jgi:LacI family transcriptional regulator